MSYLKTSQKSPKKHVETKTRTFSTPPKYLQTNHSSKGVRSTSYVHRTFVDAEAKVETNDNRFSDMTNKQLKELLKALGVKPTGTTKSDWQKQISDLLGKNFDATKLPAFKTRLAAIYKFVSGETFDSGNLTKKEIVAELTNLISLEINGRPATIFNNYTNETPTVKKPPRKAASPKVVSNPGETKDAHPDQNTKPGTQVKKKTGKTIFTLSKLVNKGTEWQLKKNGKGKLTKGVPFDKLILVGPPPAKTKTVPTAPTAATKTAPTKEEADEYYKKIFLELWEKVKDINRKDIDKKIRSLSPDKGDVIKMLKELQNLLDKSGTYVPPVKARGLFLARAADKDKNKTLNGKEIRAMIQSDIELKDLFTIGKTGELDVNLEPFVSWGTSRKIIDINKDGKYSFEEFAEYYLAAVLKNTARDKLINGDYADETFDRMVALFIIADKKPSKPDVTTNVMNEFAKTKEDIDNENVPVVTSSKPAKKKGKFKVGDRVKSTSKGGPTAGLTGIITKMKEKSASVTWDNNTDSASKYLTQLEPIVMDQTIIDKLQEQKEELDPVPVVTPSQTPSDKTKKVQPSPESKGPAPPVQRTRQEDAKKAQQESIVRAERDKQLAENTRNAALARQKQKKEEQDRQAAQKQEQDRQAAEKKITVEKKGDKYIIKETQAYTDYKKKLNKIPPTTCKPTK